MTESVEAQFWYGLTLPLAQADSVSDKNSAFPSMCQKVVWTYRLYMCMVVLDMLLKTALPHGSFQTSSCPNKRMKPKGQEAGLPPPPHTPSNQKVTHFFGPIIVQILFLCESLSGSLLVLGQVIHRSGPFPIKSYSEGQGDQ